MNEMQWEWIVPLVIAVLTAIVKTVQGGKYKKYLDAAVNLNRIVYSATEEANAKGVKILIAEGVEMAKSGEIKEINDLIHPLVDADKAATVPPIKRFWRRFLAGKNPAGVVARIAMKNALAQSLEKE